MQRHRIGQDRIEENNLEWDGMDRKQSFEYNKGIILIRKKKNFNPFFDWVTFLKNIELLSFLYILMIISLSITSFTDIFSQPKDSLFIFVLHHYAKIVTLHPSPVGPGELCNVMEINLLCILHKINLLCVYSPSLLLVFNFMVSLPQVDT